MGCRETELDDEEEGGLVGSLWKEIDLKISELCEGINEVDGVGYLDTGILGLRYCGSFREINRNGDEIDILV